jgi:hypothetical protein
MARPTQLLSLLLLGICAAIGSSQATAQALKPIGMPQWDSTNQVLFFGYGYPVQFVRAYEGVERRGADIDIDKDFPGLREAGVESLTAGPDGTTMIAVLQNFGNRNIREPILTYDSTGRLLKTWNPAPQIPEAIAYSKDDDAIFVLGESNLPEGPYAPDYPLLIEYSRDGRVLKIMLSAATLKDKDRSFHQNGEVGETTLKVTKDQIYIYAPTNREAVICDHDGKILGIRSITDAVDKLIAADDFHLVQIHALDFNDYGDIVLEVLRSNDVDYSLDVVRINIETGESAYVHKSLNGGYRWFLGIKDGQYLYLEDGNRLYVQAADGRELEPLVAAETK